jgi:hypothetical protein
MFAKLNFPVVSQDEALEAAAKFVSIPRTRSVPSDLIWRKKNVGKARIRRSRSLKGSKGQYFGRT